MRKPAYPYRRCNQTTYEFISLGKEKIVKKVEFCETEIEGIASVGFGDLLEDGTLSDEANSNNGDFIMVMTTVIKIIEDYTAPRPHQKIFFEGSTPRRTRLYGWILKNHYKEFTKCFIITAIQTDTLTEVPFDPEQPHIYDVYIIQRIL
jgi:hypothetical protein